MAEQTFDPRFDPAFQRGYVPLARPQPSKRVEAPEVVVPLPEEVAPGDPEVVTGEVRLEPVPHRVNPYIVVLWAIGVIFAVGGAVLLFASYLQLFRSSFAGRSQDAVAQTLYVVGSVFAAPLITAGLATVAGLVFLSAWRSLHRHDGAGS